MKNQIPIGKTIILAITLCMFGFGTQASAATRTWSAFAATTSWGTASNWVENAVPASGDDVVFLNSATVVLESATQIGTLTLSAGADVGFTANGLLTITGTLTLGAGSEINLGNGTASYPLQLNGNILFADGNSASDPTRIYSSVIPWKLIKISSASHISMGGIANAYFGDHTTTLIQLNAQPFTSDVRFEGNLQFTTTNNILLGANNLYLGKSCELTVTAVFPSGDGFIATDGTAATPQGTVRRQFDAVADSFYFPVGPVGGRMSPIRIKIIPPSTSAIFTSASPWPYISVRCLLNSSGSTGGHPMNFDNSRIWVYWPVKGVGISEPAYLSGRMYLHTNYRSGDPKIYSARWTPNYEDLGSLGIWDLTGSLPGTTTGNTREVPFSGCPGFGDFNIGTGIAGDPLPVELTSFSARYIDRSVRLNWNTATELNNYGFSIERSQDNETWEEVGFVEGYGTSLSPKSYTHTDMLTDDLAKVPQLAYRLRQIDRDGTTDYSNIVFVKTGTLPAGVEMYAAYPNPFNPSTTLSFTIQDPATVNLKVYNTFGQEVATLLSSSAMDAGLHTVSFNGEQLPSGVYMAVLEANGTLQQQKFVLNK